MTFRHWDRRDSEYSLEHTRGKRKNKGKTKQHHLLKDKFLSSSYSPLHPPRRKCDLPEGAHSAAQAEKVH